MDPITAFGLAAGILQVIDVSSKALSACRELYKDGSLAEYRDTETITCDLAATLDQLNASVNRTATSRATIDKDIMEMSKKCSAIAKDLIAELEKFKVGKQDGKRKALTSSLRIIRGKGVVKGLQEKLDRYKRLLDTQILVRLDARSLQQTADFSSLDRSVQALVVTLNQGHKTVADLLPALTTQNQALHDHIDRKFNDLEHLKHDQMAQQDFRKSLFFPEILSRQEQIKEAHEGTCHWIFHSRQEESGSENDDQSGTVREQQWSDFPEWLQSDQGIYWISGKAGSGKSTLMEYIRSEQARTETCLAHWAESTDLITVYFYFWNPGTELQKSSQGLLRSLLYQIVDQRPDMLSLMLGQSEGPSSESNNYPVSGQLHAWTERRLLNHLQWFLKQKPSSLSICCFIDGLDEFVGDQDVLLELIRLLHQTPQVKVCVSSRPEQIFRLEFHDAPQLRLPDFNRRDIQKTTDDKLKRILTQKFPDQEKKIIELVEKISERAQGVFLWLDIVIREIINGIRNEDNLLELEGKLDILPDSIDGLYKHMINKLDKSYRDEASHYFRVLTAFREKDTLPCTLLQLACMEGQSWQHSLRNDRLYFASATFAKVCGALEIRILTRCAGLVELARPPQNISDLRITFDQDNSRRPSLRVKNDNLASYLRTVSFIHRSASDFMTQYHKDLFRSTNWGLIGNLDYARGQIGTISLLSMLFAPEQIQGLLEEAHEVSVSIDSHIASTIGALLLAEEHAHFEQVDQPFTNDVVEMVEHLHQILCRFGKEITELASPRDDHREVHLLQRLSLGHTLSNDASCLAAFCGAQSAVSHYLSSRVHSPQHLSRLLLCTAQGSHTMGSVNEKYSPHVEIVHLLLVSGVDPGLMVTLGMQLSRRNLNYEQSVWKLFLTFFDQLEEKVYEPWPSVFTSLLSIGLWNTTSVLSGELFVLEVAAEERERMRRESGDPAGLGRITSCMLAKEETPWIYLKRQLAENKVRPCKELDDLLRPLKVCDRTRFHALAYYNSAGIYRLSEAQSERLLEAWDPSFHSFSKEAQQAITPVCREVIAELSEADIIDPETFVLRSTFEV